MAFGVLRTSMVAPKNSRNTPTSALVPFTMPVKKPPICSTCGTKEFSTTPISIGTTMVSPGNRLNFIFFIKPRVLTSLFRSIQHDAAVAVADLPVHKAGGFRRKEQDHLRGL